MRDRDSRASRGRTLGSMAPANTNIPVTQAKAQPRSKQHDAQSDQACGCRVRQPGPRGTYLSASKSKTLSRRMGAYRQPGVAPAQPAKENAGTHGLLILKDRAVSFPPDTPMSRVSPLDETLNEGPLFHYCKMTTFCSVARHGADFRRQREPISRPWCMACDRMACGVLFGP